VADALAERAAYSHVTFLFPEDEELAITVNVGTDDVPLAPGSRSVRPGAGASGGCDKSTTVHQVTALRFPAEIAVGEVWWEDAPESGGWGHLLAIGTVEVPDGTAVRLYAGRGYGEEAVDLEFIRGLPAHSVFDLSLIGKVVPASFAAVGHLAPGLRDLSVYLDNLGDEAPSVIAELTALERLSLAGH
jgi:hypothetical protein